MDKPPSDAEIQLCFVTQVRKFKPMAQTWDYLDQGILRNVEDPRPIIVTSNYAGST